MRKSISKKTMKQFSRRLLKSFNSRYAYSQKGVDASYWIKKQWEKIVSPRPDITIESFDHDDWSQISVIATIPGSENSNDVVILGAHLDSTSSRDGSMTPDKPAPGADDDASGITVITEALRSIINTGYRPRKTIQIQAYAVEELGLIGSRDIAKTYLNEGYWNVVGMVQFDMVGYKGNEKAIMLTEDFSNVDHSRFLCDLVAKYMPRIQCRLFKCRYGCSDHAAWYEQGFPATLASEAGNNPYYHKETDTFKTIDKKYMVSFAKMAVVYLAELAKGTCEK